MSEEIGIYLGNKGYTIYKECLELSEQKAIRKELTVKPYIPKSPVQPDSFAIYRESHNKFYIPRFYGLDNYGDPDENRLPKGKSISLEFKGHLHEYQKIIVNKYIVHVNQSGGGLLDVDPGKGKTVMALYIASKLKVKTLVIVHKSFLLNQWIERIQQFLPDAKVGKIQGPTIDVEEKDIVIGMLQSLSSKEYSSEVFKDFGLSIYDEVHHLSAEVFSRCMMNIPTNYSLGLSGTMQRKDGLSKVFKMFLGDVVHKEKNKDNYSVLVKQINYRVDDDEFNEIKYDYRGNPQYSTMITKLCNYNRRGSFIIEVIKEELKKNTNQQMMILAHNKTLIEYLYKSIEHNKIASVGYYIGGMKEKALKESESKKIIIATYAMASEGLDIKTLTTLLMATPKSDVCQSVGRILRVKHSNPLVIDIVDSHDIFEKQWMKRRAFYIKQKYEIISSDNIKYFKDEWNIENSPGIVQTIFKPKGVIPTGKCLI
jgi:superfamily II DNA or RNA helicase